MQTKQITDEMHLLILSIKLSPTPEDILDIQRLSLNIDANYQTLLSLAYRHTVVPQLYHTFKTFLPEHPFTLLLKPYYFNIVKVNMVMGAELIRIGQLFDEADIPMLHFKGPSLAKLISDDITLRQYGDLDMLIKDKDKDKALSLLHTKHFHPEITLKKQTQKNFLDAVNVLGFKSPDTNVFIEIHWELLSGNYAIFWNEDQLWEQTQNIFIDKHPVATLNHTNYFLYLCTHGSKHLYERLSWVSDIDRYIQTQNPLNWEEIFSRAKTLGILRVLSLSLHLTKILLGTYLDLKIEERISQDACSKKLATQLIDLHFSDIQIKRKGFVTFKFLWNMRETLSDKLRFTWYALFFAKFDDFKFIQLPSYLAFLYPLIRPLRLAIKYFK